MDQQVKMECVEDTTVDYNYMILDILTSIKAAKNTMNTLRYKKRYDQKI